MAVIAVVLYHAFPSVLPGGFLGVDVFFVLSGYLITQLLWRELDATGRIDILEFWARRVRRIAPAATVVLLAISLAACLVPEANGRLIGRNVTAAALSYYNWRQISERVDYLANSDTANPVLHFWSLSVEEQFYLVWPALLAALVIYRCRKDAVIWVAGLGMLSFLAALYLSTSNAPLAFFGTGTRAWQLLLGASAALAVPMSRAANVSVVAGGGLLLLALGVLLAGGGSFSPAAAITPTIGTAAILYANGGVSRAFLSIPLLANTGRISFSLYLWHWPLLAFLPTTTEWIAVAIALALILSVASYWYIEQPLRQSARLRRSKTITFALGALMVGGAAAAGIALKAHGPTTLSAIFGNDCLVSHSGIVSPPCVYGDAAGTKTVVLFGDSHAGNWFGALEGPAKRYGWRLVVRVKARCGPIARVHTKAGGSPYVECSLWHKNVLREMSENPPDLIVASGYGSGDISGEREMLSFMSSISSTVVVRDIPMFPVAGPECLRSSSEEADCSWPLAKLSHEPRYPLTLQSEMPANVHLIDLTDRVCPRDLCSARINGMLVMFDNNHLTQKFSSSMASEFEPFLK